MTVYLLVLFAFIEPPYTIQMPGYESDDDFDYRDDKLRQPKPASYVVRSLSAGSNATMGRS